MYGNIEDIPIWHWDKAEEGEYQYLYMDAKKQVPIENDRDKVMLMLAWDNLMDQYVNHFGFDKKYTQYLKKMKAIALLRCDAHLNNERFKLALADSKEAELNTMNEGQEKVPLYDNVAALHRAGVKIEPKKDSALLYFTHIKQLNNE